jgi:glyoxylase-like metal-dependent hydrolase (beta-lactamase superfamily II)
VPTPFPVGPVNAYRLGGRRPALIDAGPRTPEAAAALLPRLRDAPVDVLVVTHEHVDHCGLARVLQRDHGVQLLVHEREAATLAGWDREAEARERDYEAGLLAAGVPEQPRERLRHGGRKYDRLADPVRPDGTFRGGDRLLLGDTEWEVVDAPGHTPGSFLLTRGDATFSGDTLLEHITPNALSVRESERDALVRYLDTLRRLREREWGLVHPGHGAPFSNATAVIERGLRHADGRRKRIDEELVRGPRTVYELVLRLFPDLPPNQLFLAVSEVRGHLELLVSEGALHRGRRGDADEYARRA